MNTDRADTEDQEYYPNPVTADWIAQQKSPYASLTGFIIHLLSDRKYDEFELPDGLLNLWLVVRFQSDVLNGGFQQFLCNAFDSRDGSDRFLSKTLPAVRALRLDELEPLISETIQIHEESLAFGRLHRLPDQSDAPAGHSCRTGSLDADAQAFEKSMEARFHELYEQFEALDYSWCSKLDEYIRQHPHEFIL